MNRKISNAFALLAVPLALISCSPSEEQVQSDLRKQNQKGEFIYRKSDEYFYALKAPKQNPPSKYPWDSHSKGVRTVTKEYFRCKGSNLSPERVIEQNGEIKRYSDCGGVDKHGLPMRDGKEFIYPILINILNHIQTKTEKPVIITSGHRCPEHNTYIDPSKENSYSKHMIGAEVSFYVQGIEYEPEKIVELIREYYEGEQPEYSQFLRYQKDNTNVSINPWYNKEVFVKIFQKNEGRNLDNRHPYPYISIQVRYDRDRNESVTYSWGKAHRNVLRK